MPSESRRVSIPIRLNNWVLEPLLGGLRKSLARLFDRHDLFPALDVCCGVGRQCSLSYKSRKFMIGLDKNLEALKYAKDREPGLPLVCADALSPPFRGRPFKGILFSFSLHDKPADLRLQIISEAKRLLAPEGKIILLDFEPPWGLRSKLGLVFTTAVERLAGREHFRNGREFLREGGLRTFLRKAGLMELQRYPIEEANSSIVLSQIQVSTFAPSGETVIK